MNQNNLKQKVLALVLTIAALLVGHTTALADETVSLSEDPDIPVGTAGHWYVNMHRDNTLQLTLSADDIAAGKGTFKVYDDGGKNGNYSPGCNSKLKITVPVGYFLQASGTVWTKENDIDKLWVYNSLYYGDNSLASVQSDADGVGKDFGPVVTSEANMTKGQYLTLYFYSSSIQPTYAGYDVTVTVIENTLYNVGIASGIAHGSVSVSPAQARYKDEVTITPTPDANYYIGTVSYNDGTDNTLYWPKPDLTVTPARYPRINAFRAYFQLNGITAAEVTQSRLVFGEDDVATGIDGISLRNADIPNGRNVEMSKYRNVDVEISKYRNAEMSNAPWHDLQGRRLTAPPTQPGLYIHQGRKVVVK